MAEGAAVLGICLFIPLLVILGIKYWIFLLKVFKVLD